MKKKIKDLTVEELFRICLTNSCGYCPLCFGNIFDEYICYRNEYDKKWVKEVFPTGYADFIEKEIEIYE